MDEKRQKLDESPAAAGRRAAALIELTAKEAQYFAKFAETTRSGLFTSQRIAELLDEFAKKTDALIDAKDAAVDAKREAIAAFGGDAEAFELAHVKPPPSLLPAYLTTMTSAIINPKEAGAAAWSMPKKLELRSYPTNRAAPPAPLTPLVQMYNDLREKYDVAFAELQAMDNREQLGRYLVKAAEAAKRCGVEMATPTDEPTTAADCAAKYWTELFELGRALEILQMALAFASAGARSLPTPRTHKQMVEMFEAAKKRRESEEGL